MSKFLETAKPRNTRSLSENREPLSRAYFIHNDMSRFTTHIEIYPIMITLTIRFTCLALLLGLIGCSMPEHPVTVVINPYQDVDWEHNGRHRGNFHTHTTEWGGKVEPAEVIDRYHDNEYDILALTDHNKATWPWSAFGRDPEALGMVAVPGNELSRHHHTLSLFSDFENETKDLETSLTQIDERGGLSVLAHPGRYWKLEEGKVPDEVRDRYVAHYKKHDSLIGMEVVNQGDRYPRDRALWDAVLTELMPEQPIWGMANDDSHKILHIGLNQTIMLLPEHTEQAVRQALETGSYYFATVTPHPQNERDPAGIPVIHHTDHDKKTNVITIHADCGGEPLDDGAFSWMSAGGKVIAQGPTLALNEVEGLSKYVRAEIRGTGGTTFTQPFGLRTAADMASDGISGE